MSWSMQLVQIPPYDHRLGCVRFEESNVVRPNLRRHLGGLTQAARGGSLTLRPGHRARGP